MADEHLGGGGVAAQTEGGIDLGDGLVPLQPAFVHQAREQQRGHTLGVRGDHEQGMGIYRRWLAQLADPGAGYALIDHGRIVYEGGAGYA